MGGVRFKQVLAPIWQKLSPQLRKKGVRMGQIDGSVAGTKGLMKRFGIDSYPSIFHIHEGQTRQYLGVRTREAIAEWAAKGFLKTEPLPWYLSPVNPLSRTYGLLWRVPGGIETLYRYMHNQRGMSDIQQNSSIRIVSTSASNGKDLRCIDAEKRSEESNTRRQDDTFMRSIRCCSFAG